MSTPTDATGPVVFKPRTGKWFAGITWGLVGIGLVSALVTYGADGLLAAWPLLALAFFGWWMFWYPSVRIAEEAVTITNPLRSVTVPWNALITVDTKYALTLVTPQGTFTSWAAPAPGIWGTHRGKPEHVRNLPDSTYGPAQSIRPGDLSNTDSGAAAYLVRRRWSELAESGRLEIGSADIARVTKTVHWPAIGGAVLLIAASIAAFALI